MVVLELHNSPWPKPTQLHLDTIDGLHKYTSSPEAGMPPLPFRNNALRKATDQPFFDVSDYEDEEEDKPVVVVEELIAEKLITREQLENMGSEGVLIGVQS
jgi:hypothetical protein